MGEGRVGEAKRGGGSEGCFVLLSWPIGAFDFI